MITRASITPSSCTVRHPTVVIGFLYSLTAWLSAYSQAILWRHAHFNAYATLVFELLNKVHLHMLVLKPHTCHVMIGLGLILFIKQGNRCQATCLSSSDHTLKQMDPGHILPQSTLHPLLLD